MKLCLDEHYSSQIAELLREDGHDVISVKERPDLVALSDSALLAEMIREQRALLTENVSDFAPLITAMGARSESHFGLIYSSSQCLPRSRNTIGEFVKRLSEVLSQHPQDTDFKDQVTWL